MIIWNPWHGCHKVSEGCQHCYMYFLDGKRGIDTSKVYRTENVSKASGEHKARFNAHWQKSTTCCYGCPAIG